MKKIVITSTLTFLMAPAFATTGFDEIAEKAKRALAPDAPGVQRILDTRKANWNDVGLFQASGFTDTNSNGVCDSTETLTDVRSLGLPGALTKGVCGQTNGIVKVIFPVPNTTDYPATGNDAFNYYKPLSGKMAVFTPYSIGADGLEDTVNGSSTNSGNDAVQIVGYSCAIYDASNGIVDYSAASPDEDMFVAKRAIDDDGITDAATYTELDVSYADRLPAPWNSCYGSP